MYTPYLFSVCGVLGSFSVAAAATEQTVGLI